MNKSIRARQFAPVLSVLALACGAAWGQSSDDGKLASNIVVTATRQATRVSEVLSDVTVIGAEEIRNAGPATLSELLGRQPGVEFVQNGGAGGTSSIFIRGSNSNHVLLLVDGMRMGSATTGTPAWGAIPLEQIDRIEILRGPASSLYGSDAIGGVIQIFTKRGDGPARPFVEVGYGTYNTAVLTTGVSGGQDGWRYSFQLSDKRSSSFSAINNPSNPYFNPDKDGYSNYGSSGSLSYSPANGQEVGVDYLYSDGWSRYDSTPASHDFKQKARVSSVNVYSRNRLSDDWISTVRVGQSTDDNRSLDNGQLTSLIKSTQNQYQWQNDVKLPMGVALLGVERVVQRIDSDASTTYALTERSINSLFAGWTGSQGNHSFQTNFRQDNNSQFGDKNTGMVGYGYQLANNWRSTLSVGTAFKAPTFNDLYFPPDSWGDVSNPNLKPETSTNREASLHYETANQHVSATYYRNSVKDLIQWAPIDPTFVTTFGYTPSNVASATLSGLTLAYAGNYGRYKLSGSLDLQNPKDDVLQKTLVNRAREIAKLTVGRDFGHFNIATELQATGKRYSDVDNTKELAGYALVNLRANYRVERDWSVFARLNNVFDKKYVLAQDFATPGVNLFVGVRYSPQ